MKLDSFPEDSQDEMEGSIDLQAAAKFKVVTCLSKSCNEKRKGNMVDPLATFSAMYSRAQESAPSVTVEEQPCLGSCARGPCVAIQHSDYIGNVSLEGMTEIEFSERVFHK
jgi:NADH:ubiquinone oxidoreductase subunit E